MYKRALYEEVYRVVPSHTTEGAILHRPLQAATASAACTHGAMAGIGTRGWRCQRAWETHACRAQRAPASACRPSAGLEPGVSFGMLSATVLSCSCLRTARRRGDRATRPLCEDDGYAC